MSDLYAERDIIKQEEFYTRHVSAMTKEGLDRKSDIAAELAHRDITVSNQQKHIEALQARVAELYDLIKYAQVESGVCMCGDKMQDHNQASGHSLVDVWDHAVEQIDKGGTSEAFIKRKQADAVESALQSEMAEFRLYNGTKRSGCFAQDLAAYAQRLRNDAGSVRGDL